MAILYPDRRFLHLHANELGKLMKGLTFAKLRPLRMFFDAARREWRIVDGGINYLQYLPDYSMVLEIAEDDARPGDPIPLVIRVRPRFALEKATSFPVLPEPVFPAYGSGRLPPRWPQVERTAQESDEGESKSLVWRPAIERKPEVQD